MTERKAYEGDEDRTVSGFLNGIDARVKALEALEARVKAIEEALTPPPTRPFAD